jgi:regulator of nucleoside diphosphate kinase
MEVLALDRTLTASNHARLAQLVRHDAPAGFDADLIENLLDAARVVASRDVAPDVVTMYSQVVLGHADGRQTRLTLCWPADAEPAQGFVSVLSPVGSSLLGLRVGESARWRTPLGDDASAEVAAVLFQPEANGDFTM